MQETILTEIQQRAVNLILERISLRNSYYLKYAEISGYADILYNAITDQFKVDQAHIQDEPGYNLAARANFFRNRHDKKFFYWEIEVDGTVIKSVLYIPWLEIPNQRLGLR